jgi:hypothetical protein
MIKRILPLIFVLSLSIIGLANACLSNTISGTWVNCTIITNDTPTNDLVKTLQINTGGNGTTTFGFGWFLIYVTIYLSIAIFLLIQDRSFARFNYITLLGFMVGLVFRMYSLVGTVTVTIAASLLGLSILASLFLR